MYDVRYVVSHCAGESGLTFRLSASGPDKVKSKSVVAALTPAEAEPHEVH